MKKKILIIILICIVVIIAGILIGINIKEKPTRELNKAVDMIKNGTYKEAYDFISNTENEENIRIIKELLSIIIINKMSGGIEEITEIATESTNIVYEIDKDNIDYSLDDQVDIRVEGLKDYIDFKNKIPKDLLIPEVIDIYDGYFNCLDYVYNNCKSMLNRIKDKEFPKEIQDLSNEMYTIAVKIQSFVNNYKCLSETDAIYEENEKYF